MTRAPPTKATAYAAAAAARSATNASSPSNAHKLRTSLERALHKRPFDNEDVDDLVASIEGRLYRLGQKEVSSRTVGEMAMDVLLATDQVAYVRFASVYKSFKDVSEFTQAIATLPEQREDA